MIQRYLNVENYQCELKEVIEKEHINRIFCVCGESAKGQDCFKFIQEFANRNEIQICLFQEFSPNPDYLSVIKGLQSMREYQCDSILAIGGGSAIDVAKCIKLQYEKENGGELIMIAVPTTAGTGSESTKFAVVYENGRKISIEDKAMLPNYVLLNGQCLKSLPLYRKKVTLLDALCHSIESYWSINSTNESKSYCRMAIETICCLKQRYIDEDVTVYEKMMLAANQAGKAINITKTTAAHALSYKITTLYHVPHGMAVAICLPAIWNYMNEHKAYCIDVRGITYIEKIFEELLVLMNTDSVESVICQWKAMLKNWGVCPIINPTDEEMELLVNSVNEERLKNTPIKIMKEDLYSIYKFAFDL